MRQREKKKQFQHFAVDVGADTLKPEMQVPIQMKNLYTEKRTYNSL